MQLLEWGLDAVNMNKNRTFRISSFSAGHDYFLGLVSWGDQKLLTSKGNYSEKSRCTQ